MAALWSYERSTGWVSAARGPRMVFRAENGTLTWSVAGLGQAGLVWAEFSERTLGRDFDLFKCVAEDDPHLLVVNDIIFAVLTPGRNWQTLNWDQTDPHYTYSDQQGEGGEAYQVGETVVWRTKVKEAFTPRGSERQAISWIEPSPYKTQVLHDALYSACQAAAHGVREVDVLFSGGLDSTLLARMLGAVNSVEKVRLWNVSFDGACAPDRLTALLGFYQLARGSCVNSKFELYCRDVQPEEHAIQREEILDAIWPKNTLMDFTIGSTLFFAGQLKGRRVTYEQVVALLQPLDDRRLCDELIELGYIEEEKKTKKRSAGAQTVCPSCEKYIIKESCEVRLCRSCCRKRSQEAESHWCAAHRVGESPAEQKPCALEERLLRLWPALYESLPEFDMLLAKGAEYLLVCGNGADELFGGYGRYRTRAMHGQQIGWRDEMHNDVEGLWLRNLGRDERVLLAAGRRRVSCALPYLADSVVEYVNGLSNETLWGIHFDHNKALLRQVAQPMLPVACRLRKRAMQFGSRSASTVSRDTPRRERKGTAQIFGNGVPVPA